PPPLSTLSLHDALPISHELDAPRLGVDLDDGDVGAERIRRLALVEVELGPQALLEVGRASSRVAGCHGQLRPRQCRGGGAGDARSEEHTSELQSLAYLV